MLMDPSALNGDPYVFDIYAHVFAVFDTDHSVMSSFHLPGD